MFILCIGILGSEPLLSLAIFTVRRIFSLSLRIQSFPVIISFLHGLVGLLTCVYALCLLHPFHSPPPPLVSSFRPWFFGFNVRVSCRTRTTRNRHHLLLCDNITPWTPTPDVLTLVFLLPHPTCTSDYITLIHWFHYVT